jgi:guanine deaminase
MNAEFMREAIRLSEEKMQANEGGPFGALVVKSGEIIGRGWNCVTSQSDPTAHAEVVAIREACRTLNDFSLKGCEIYASCEPCPMCLAAIYWSRLERMYYAATRKDAAGIGFDDDQIYQEIGKPIPERAIPMVQLMRDEATAVFRKWSQKEDRIEY